MKQKLQVGDPVLVVGPSHYEKALVLSIEKGIITLNNQMKIDRDYKNITHTSMTAKPWDEGEFNYLHAIHRYKGLLSSIQYGFDKLSREDKIALNKKLEKIVAKFNLKRI